MASLESNLIILISVKKQLFSFQEQPQLHLSQRHDACGYLWIIRSRYLYIFNCVYIYRVVAIGIYVFMCLFIYLFMYLYKSISISTSISICLFLCLSIYYLCIYHLFIYIKTFDWASDEALALGRTTEVAGVLLFMQSIGTGTTTLL